MLLFGGAASWYEKYSESAVRSGDNLQASIPPAIVAASTYNEAGMAA